MSDRTQDLKNLRAVATACKNYVDETKEQILWQVGQYDITTQDDNTTAYQKVVPTGATRAKIKSIGFMSYKCNQLFDNDNTELITKTFNDSNQNVYSYYGFAMKVFNLTIGQTYTISTTKNIYVGQTDNVNNSGISRQIGGGTSYTFTATTNYLLITNQLSNEYTEMFENLMLNYGSTALPYQPYFTGLRDSVITSVKSYDSNNNLIDTYTVPSEIQALEGYGRGINENCYNVLDLDTKVFTDKDNRYQFTGNETWNAFNQGRYASVNLGGKTYDAYTEVPNMLPDFDTTVNARDTVLTQGGRRLSMNNNNVIVGDGITNEELVEKSFYYELATYNITDNLELPDNVIEVEAGGYLVFENQYGQAVPSNITYRIEVAR